MDTLLQEALESYEFENPVVTFIRHNENITYKITCGEKQYLLRIHKPIDGFSLGIVSNDEKKLDCIQGEMLLLEHLQKQEQIKLQTPVKNKKQLLVSVLEDGTPVTVLEWIDGVALTDIEITCDTAEKIGAMVANMHNAFKNIKVDQNGNLYLEEVESKLRRYQYRQQLLKRITYELKLVESEGHITGRQLNIILDAVEVIEKRMDELCELPGMMGFVHADLSPSNMILTANDEIIPIDFSLSGVGFYYMDIGMMLSAFNNKDVRRCLKSEYEKKTGVEVPICYIEAFFALGVILYIVSQHNKAYKEDWFEEAMERWCSTIFSPLIHDKTFVF